MPGQQGGFLRSKIARRIFALFVLSALLPLGVLAFFSFTQISGKLQEQADHRLNQRVRDIGYATNERLLQLEGSLGDLCKELASMDEPDLSATTENSHWNMRYMFQSLILLDLEPNEFDQLLSDIPTISFETLDREHLDQGKTLLFTRAQGESSARAFLACKLLPGDPASGILVGEINPEHFWESIAMSYEFETLVFDHLGRVLYTTIPDLDPAIPLREISLDINMKVRWEGPDSVYRALSWQLFLQPHFGDEWTFLLSQDEADILGPMQSLRRNFLLVTLFSFLLVTLMSSQLIRRSMTPILSLRAATIRVSAEDFDARVEITSDDELGELGRAFNEMTSRLSEYRNEREQNEQDLLDACENALRAATIESQFLANVSHELRTPITSIRSFAELLREYGDEHAETREEFLGIIVAESDRLMRLIEDILDFSKLSTGGLRMDYKRGQVQDSLQDVFNSLEPLAKRSGAIMELEVIGELPEIWFDRDRMIQVWTNLISNAIKFSMLPGDKIQIIAKVEARHIVVEVSDEGPGIRSEDQQSIFQRFRQVSNDLITDKPKGTGLGLTIANDIISYHEGRIEVESVEGEGATFRVYLPILSRPPKLKGPPPSSESQVLVI